MPRDFAQPIRIAGSYLEFSNPAGTTPNVAPAGKTRVYVNASGTLLQSISGGAYSQVASSGAAGDTLTIGTDVTLTRSAADQLTLSDALVITSPAAGSLPLTINADAAQSADLVLIQQSDGTDRWRMTAAYTLLAIVPTSGTPTITSLIGAVEVRGNAANHNDVTVNIRNYNTGNASARYALSADACSGYLGAYGTGTTTPTATVADSIVLGLGSDAAHLFLYAPTSGQALRFYAGSSTETARFDTGALRIGGSLTTAIAKLQVVGQADEAQCVIRGNSTQTAALLSVQTSAGAGRLVVGGDGRLYCHLAGTAVTDGNMNASSFSVWLNEAGNTLTFRVKYADGTTLKTGTVALT